MRELYVANKNYSSWSLRPWLLMKQLNIPFTPNFPGIETFRGAAFHSARWDHSVDLKGKTVAVIGLGSLYRLASLRGGGETVAAPLIRQAGKGALPSISRKAIGSRATAARPCANWPTLSADKGTA